MAATINIQEIPKQPGTAASIALLLQGFTAGEDIEVSLWEDDTEFADSLIPDPKAKTVQPIGKIKGTVAVALARGSLPPLQSLSSATATKQAKSKLKLLLAFPQVDGRVETAELFLPDEKADAFEGDNWEIFATTEAQGGVTSTTTLVARIRRALSVQQGQATYSYYQGHATRFYNDASTDLHGTDGYLFDVVKAIREAKDFIYIADWSFHPFMRPRHSGPYGFVDTIGGILIAHAVLNPNMLIAIHVWDHTNVGAKDDQNDDGDAQLNLIAKQHFGMSKRPSNLLWRKSSRTGTGFSHHQKFVVMDAPLVQEGAEVSDRKRLRAFLGGIDLTKGRCDWGTHAILATDPQASEFINTFSFVAAGAHLFDDWYNAEFYSLDAVNKPPEFPRQPWHDIAAQIVGPACWDLVREFVGRWLAQPLGGLSHGDTDGDAVKAVQERFKAMFAGKKDPKKDYHWKQNPLIYSQQWDPAGTGPWSVQICRSMVKEHWEQSPPLVIPSLNKTRREFRWTVGGSTERSIQLSYLQAISQAEDFIYLETQYFISSGSMWSRGTVRNAIASSLAQRAVERSKAGKPFHIYLVIPLFPEGKPGDGSNAAQRQFQWASIRAMARQIERDAGRPWQELLSVFFVARWTDLGAKPVVNSTRENNVKINRRYQIYVHAKFMLVDDRFLFIGSANLNERSLAGDRDSEIGAAFWPSDDTKLKGCIKQATELRTAIWQEHLGPAFPTAFAGQPGSPGCVKAIQDAASENYNAFREGRFDAAKHGHLCLWPIEAEAAKPPLKAVSGAPEGDHMLPDRPFGLSGDDLHKWQLDAPGTFAFTLPHVDIAE
jgi:phospholipase D1/2